MITGIGLCAGEIWKLLDEKGRLEFSEVVKENPDKKELMLILGSHLGANHFSGRWLKRILAVVLFVASFKLFMPLF